jgi:hypothetical protein
MAMLSNQLPLKRKATVHQDLAKFCLQPSADGPLTRSPPLRPRPLGCFT